MAKFDVWVIGQKETTKSTIEAESKLDAQIRFAGRNGIKSFQVEARAFKEVAL